MSPVKRRVSRATRLAAPPLLLLLLRPLLLLLIVQSMVSERDMTALPPSTGAALLTVLCVCVCACVCVTAGLVVYGPALPSEPLKDEHGQHICICCNIRLSKLHGKRMHMGAARMCQHCKDEPTGCAS
jgi:hypothetical protein